ncbi:MAG TPA: glycosyltransferase family 2 protein [Thermoanaerobaculia bacterium]|nr:glycosyltransferase family 2 protein [Thermoanaerobaculia bacterium]
MKLIIQIPAYNEEKTIGITIKELPRQIPGITSIETLLIDDGSEDATIDVARRAGVTHVVRVLNHRGLSTAFTTGIDAALRLGADIIVNTDADNQYKGSDIAKVVAPIIDGLAEVVIGDRGVKASPHMSSAKKMLQRLGSWSVGRAAGIHIPDVTSGLRGFSREAAYQINVFNPFTYTLETIIQAGNRNLGVVSVPVGTNPPTRPSRLYTGISHYLRKSAVTIFRIYTLYKPLKTFSALAAIFLTFGLILGIRFLIYFFNGNSDGHVQSLILAAILLIVGFQTFLIGLVSDLIAVNRRISEEILIRTRKMAGPEREVRPRTMMPKPREPRRDSTRRPSAVPRPAVPSPLAPPPATPETQWVWLLDEKKLSDREPVKKLEIETSEVKELEAKAPRRRRRRRGGSGRAAQGTAAAQNPGEEPDNGSQFSDDQDES